MSCKFISIAIDGPAAAGKSTVAKTIAKEMNFVYIDTGAMYRAFAYFVLSKNIDPNNEDLCSKELANFNVKFNEQGRIFLNGKDISDFIRTMEVSKAVTPVSTFKDVRANLAQQQREMSYTQNVVMDGRDIGTNVLPNANVKIYMVASADTRAQRRYKENQEKGIACTLNDVIEDLKRRDYVDSHREFSPLKKADDAIEFDSSNYTIRETADEIKKIIESKIN